MRIAEIHWAFPPIIGGVETHLAILCPELVKKGHKVNLLTGMVEGEKADDEYRGVKIKRSPLMDLNWLGRRGMEELKASVEQLFSEFFEQSRPEVIHAHNLHYFSPLHALTLERLAKKLKIPLVLHVHNVWDDGLFLELTLKVGWQHMIAISHFIKKELTGFGVPDEKITVIHHGIDRERFRRKETAEKLLKKYPQLKGKRIIFHPARIGLAKGSDVSVKALRRIKKKFPDAFLILAGSKNIVDWVNSQQKDIAFILHLIHNFNLKENVLIDHFTLEEMGGLYQLCEFCFYPSSFGEPFGLTMLEAMAAGKPIIVTDSGGMPEIIKEEVNGFIIRTRDWEALAERSMTLLADEALRIKVGDKGQQMVEEFYNKERMTDDILKVFELVRSRSK